jgi:uncharacterized protein YjbI with pentapeptide repeats
LPEADLIATDRVVLTLNGADLGASYLRGADLSMADLIKANLIGARLSGADLIGAKGWTHDQLSAAWPLEGATMPNGQKYEDWRKDIESREE